MSLSPYSATLPTGFIKREYIVYDGKIGRDQLPVLNFSLPEFHRVTFATVRVTLGATRQDIPLLGWKIENVKINGRSFVANHPVNALIEIQNTSKKLITLKELENNQIIITHSAPLGAGTPLTGDIPCVVQLFMIGQEASPEEKARGTGQDLMSNLKNAQNALVDLAKNNTPLAIAVLVIFAVLIIGIGYILSQTTAERRIATSAISEVKAE